MNGLKSIPNWILWTAAALAAALVFRFAMRGYAYIGYTLAFIAALIVFASLSATRRVARRDGTGVRRAYIFLHRGDTDNRKFAHG